MCDLIITDAAALLPDGRVQSGLSSILGSRAALICRRENSYPITLLIQMCLS